MLAMEEAMPSTPDAGMHTHQKAYLNCEDGGVHKEFNQCEKWRLHGSILITFTGAMMLGFFVVGPLCHQATADYGAKGQGHDNFLSKFAAMNPVVTSNRASAPLSFGNNANYLEHERTSNKGLYGWQRKKNCRTIPRHRQSRMADTQAGPSGDSSSWRPKTIDPLGKAFAASGYVTRAPARSHQVWLDLRTSEETFARMEVMKLFYGVRRVVDEAGKTLPDGARVQGLLFDEARYDRAEAVDSNLPIFVETSAGIVNATLKATWNPISVELRSPTTVDELVAAQEELECGSHETAALALSGDPLLWAVAITGLEPSQLEPLEANKGA